MTITEEMLTAAADAAVLLGEDRADEVRRFYAGRMTEDGGFAGRAGKSDLYYTVFGLQACGALGVKLPEAALRQYLTGFGLGKKLDMVHVSCLARCWATLGGQGAPAGLADALLARVEACRSADGGYAQQAGAQTGSTYGCFLALGTYEDLGGRVPDPDGVAACLSALAVGDGSYANDTMLPLGSAPATAAAVMVLTHIGAFDGTSAAGWLVSQHAPEGGFRAISLAPEPDLLSTAVAVQALRRLGADVAPIRESCLRFVNSLYASGGFGGHQADASPDAEYTFYGLTALGCLA